MAQHTEVTLPPIAYSRVDHIAFRAYCLNVPLKRISDLYYDEDSAQVVQGLERWLIGMRKALIARLQVLYPAQAEALHRARRGAPLSKQVLNLLIRVAEASPGQPERDHPVGRWFRLKTAKVLQDEGVTTLGDLVDMINRRGPGWWRGVPRIGAGRAVAIVQWLGKWHEALGDVGSDALLPVPTDHFDLLPLLNPRTERALLPLGSYRLPDQLSGMAGANRSMAFCFIRARNDLEAINSYLLRYAGQPHTERAYRKELERFMLWCALVAYRPMSSLLVDDCEAYKRFLAEPLPEFCGPRAQRSSRRWRPFTNTPMSAASQRHAVTVLRAMFDWLTKVRYLAGNPWVAVNDPVVIKQAEPMQIDRALDMDLWSTVLVALSERGKAPSHVQDRVALTAILLMGDSGLRRSEVATARRDSLRPGRHATGVWTLVVIGKRNKQRKVPVSPRTIVALRDHWHDRGLDFNEPNSTHALIAPVVIPGTITAKARHNAGSTGGYHSNSLYDVVVGALQRLCDAAADSENNALPPFSADHLAQLAQTAPHAFRHTFGTLAVEADMPVVVAQEILGHASASTTAIYVRAKDRRVEESAAQYYTKASGPAKP